MTAHVERPERDGLPAGVVDDLLGDPRRRTVLSVLADRAEPTTVCDLAAAVAAREREDPDPPAGATAAVREDLFQEHLPKLTAPGVVVYDSMTGAVELTDRRRVTAWLTERRRESTGPGDATLRRRESDR